MSIWNLAGLLFQHVSLVFPFGLYMAVGFMPGDETVLKRSYLEL